MCHKKVRIFFLNKSLFGCQSGKALVIKSRSNWLGNVLKNYVKLVNLT